MGPKAPGYNQFLFPPNFGIDFEVDRDMSKDTFCAYFRRTSVDELCDLAGEVTYLSWAPSYYRTAPGT